MKRRQAIQAVLFFSVAGGALISCKNKHEAITKLNLSNVNFKDNELDVLDEVSKVILPTDNIPEFKNHTALPFILTMLNDCYSKEDQESFTNGFKKVQEMAQTKYNKTFSSCASEDKLALLTEIGDQGIDKPSMPSAPSAPKEKFSPEKTFLNIMKGKTLQYYTTTEFYMRKYRLYEMAPGRFKGCVKIEEIQTKNL
jgi:hypothetical protein